MSLESLRKKIRALDARVVALLAARQALMPAVGAWKRSRGLAIAQPAREAEVLAAVSRLARERGLDAALARKIFRLVMSDARRIQRRAGR